MVSNMRSVVFVGESGSGKTELAVNLAIYLAKQGKKKVCLFDMDQTKGMFRARDMKKLLEKFHVSVLHSDQFLDSPIVPNGISGVMAVPEIFSIFDVGGSAIGARMIGQYSEILNQGQYFYVINPERPFSSSAEDLESSIYWILTAGRITSSQISLISNPCLGDATTAGTVLQAHKNLTVQLRRLGKELSALTVKEDLFNDVSQVAECPVYPLRLYVKELYAV